MSEFFKLKVYKIMPDLSKVECDLDDFDLELRQIRMPDDSMVLANVNKDDTLCFSSFKHYDDNDLVICLIDDKYTLRQYKELDNNKIGLISYGPESKHTVITKEDADIAGKLIYVMELGKALDVDDILNSDKPKIIN